MSKESRTVEEIQKDYTGLCLKAGHLQYQISVLTEDLKVVNSTLKDLNFEAAAVKAAEVPKEPKKEDDNA